MDFRSIIPKQLKIAYRYGRYTKKKNGKKNKIKLVFFMSRPEVFNSYRSIFESTIKDSSFEPYILALTRNYDNDKKRDYDSNYKYCIKMFDSKYVIKAYDEKGDSFITIDDLNPDYVFIDIPYQKEYPEQYRVENIATKTKICYSSYGYTMEKNSIQNITINPQIIAYVSFIFCNSEVMYKAYRNKTWISELFFGKRVYNIGFARFDQYRIPKEKCCKIADNKKTILWLPRWTTDVEVKECNNKPSSFFDVKDEILDFVNANKEVNLIIRPHPLAFSNYMARGIMTQEEVDRYCENIKSSDKIVLDDKEEYLDSVLNSDILFADYTSLLAEYFVLDRPVVFFGTVGEQASEMFKSFYQVNSWEQAKKILLDLVSGIDPKKEIRHNMVTEFWNQHPQNIGEKIIDVIKKDFFK